MPVSVSLCSTGCRLKAERVKHSLQLDSMKFKPVSCFESRGLSTPLTMSRCSQGLNSISTSTFQPLQFCVSVKQILQINAHICLEFFFAGMNILYIHIVFLYSNYLWLLLKFSIFLCHNENKQKNMWFIYYKQLLNICTQTITAFWINKWKRWNETQSMALPLPIVRILKVNKTFIFDFTGIYSISETLFQKRYLFNYISAISVNYLLEDVTQVKAQHYFSTNKLIHMTIWFRKITEL